MLFHQKAPMLLNDLSVFRGFKVMIDQVDRFTGAGFGNRLWGLPLYYAAQLVFAATAAA